MESNLIQLSSGRKLAYAEYGDPNGKPLFYYHGWPSSRLQGKLLDQIGKKRGFRVISPDRPGIGKSDFQPGRRFLDWPVVIGELADQLKVDVFDLVGVSGGGPYVLATLHAIPERVRKSLVICGAPPLADVGREGMMWPYRLAMMIHERAPKLLDRALRLAESISNQPRDGVVMRMMMASLGEEDHKALTDDFAYQAIVGSFQEAMKSGSQVLREDGDLYLQPWGFDVAELRKSPKFFHGGMDKNIPLKLVESYIQRIPGSALVVRERDGHYSLPVLRSEEFIDELLAD